MSNAIKAQIIYGLATVLAALTMPAMAQTPSFDCARPKLNPAEARICADDDLAALDRAMAASYRQVIQAKPAAALRLRGEQRLFLLKRDECPGLADQNAITTCIAGAMRERMKRLEDMR
jgi:uncharacterized protein